MASNLIRAEREDLYILRECPCGKGDLIMSRYRRQVKNSDGTFSNSKFIIEKLYEVSCEGCKNQGTGITEGEAYKSFIESIYKCLALKSGGENHD